MMEAVRTSETLVDNHFTWQYIPEDNSEHNTEVTEYFAHLQGVGDCNLAMQCLRLSLSADSNHAPAYNNLGVLEMRLGHCEQARAFFQAAGSLAPYLFEPHHNFAKLAEKVKCFCFP
jgi:tetratricopeptide repeat protein 8